MSKLINGMDAKEYHREYQRAYRKEYARKNPDKIREWHNKYNRKKAKVAKPKPKPEPKKKLGIPYHLKPKKDIITNRRDLQYNCSEWMVKNWNRIYLAGSTI